MENYPQVGSGAPWWEYSSSISSIVIKEGVTTIGERAFYNLEYITSITLPEGITAIGERALAECINLQSVKFPKNLVTIGGNAFYCCFNLTEIILPDNLITIGEGAFTGCLKISSIELPAGITTISKDTFSGCEGLQEIILSEGITAIGEGAFSSCSNLKKVTLPKILLSLGDGAFYCCFNLTEIILPDSLTTIGKRAFTSCLKISSIELPAGITTISKEAFAGCESLQEIILPKSLEIIEDLAFTSCYKLQRVFFGGTQAEWDSIMISGGNNDLLEAMLYVQDEEEPTEPEETEPTIPEPTEPTVPEETEPDIPEETQPSGGSIGTGTPDSKPPVLHGITLSAYTVTPGSTIEVIVDASDDVSGLNYGHIWFWCEDTEKELHCYVDTIKEEYWDEDGHHVENYPDGKLHGTLEIDQYVETGTFQVRSVELRDIAGNYRSYNMWAEPEYEPDRVFPESVKSLSFNVMKSDTPDSTPPVLHGITLSAYSVTAPGTIEVTVDASDDVSGLNYGYIWFWCEETQKELYCHVDTIKEEYWDEDGYHLETYEDGKLHGILNIDQYVETGTFQVRSIDLRDIAENYRSYNMWAEPEYEPDRVLPESVKSLSLHIFNTIPDVTTSVANPGFVDKLEQAEDNAYIVADYSGDATLTEDVFQAIAGTDKTLDLASDGITWRFNGKDITEGIKPIDLKVDIQPMEFMLTPEAVEIQEKLEEAPGVIMKFAENGQLPGKATIQVKVDYTMREYLGSDENLCVYYYNNQTGKLELIAEGLKVVNDTYVEFSITHCSYYVLTPKLPEEEGCGYEPGDVNHDGKINAKDATLILQKSVGVLKETAKFCEACAEVSGDGKLNAKDSTLILQFSVGLRSDFPVSQ